MSLFRFLKKLEVKFLDLITFQINLKKTTININQIDYDNFEMRDLKITIIEHHLNNLNLKKSFKEQLLNYLFLFDKTFQRKACLVNYLLERNVNIEKISAPFLSEQDFDLFKRLNLNIRKIKPNEIVISILKSFGTMLLLFINSIKEYYIAFHLFPENKSRFDPNIKYYTLLRAKVENYERLYLQNLGKSLDNTIISVGSYNVGREMCERQKSYLKHLEVKKRNYFFYIPKINWFEMFESLIRIYFSVFPNQFKIPFFQILLKRKAVEDYLKYIKKKFPDIQECYINEEFQPESVYMTEKLKELKILAKNLSHGLGTSGPIVNFDVFYVFSKTEKALYRGSAKFDYYKIKTPLEKKVLSPQKNFALFFVCTCCFKSRKFKSIYKEVVDFVEKIARDYPIPVYAKYHPDSTEEDKFLSDKIKIIEKLEDLPQNYSYLSVAFISTFVIDLLNSMPFIILNPQGLLNLSFYSFPNDKSIYITSYQEFKEKIEKFSKDYNFYIEYWNYLIDLIQKNYSF